MSPSKYEYRELNAMELRAECDRRLLSTRGTPAQMAGRLVADDRRIAAADRASKGVAAAAKEAATLAERAALPPPTVGHRIVLRDGRVIPIVLEYAFPHGTESVFYRASLEVPAEHAEECWSDTTTAVEEDRAVYNLVRNLMMAMPLAEWLSPGQKTRSELESEIEALKRLLKEEHHP